MQRAGHVGPKPGQLRGGQRRLHVQLAGAQPPQRRLGIDRGIIIDDVDLHRRGVIEAGIFRQGDMVVRRPGLQQIRPVGDIRAGLEHGARRQGQGRRQGEQLGQIGRGIFQGDFQRRGIGRDDAKRRGRHGPGADGMGVLQHPQILRRARSGRRVQHPPPGGEEIACRHGGAVRPARLAQMEGPGQSVLGCLPAFGDAGDRPRRRIQGGQPHHYVAQDIGFHDAAGMGGVQRLRLGAIAAVQHALRLRRKRSHQQQRLQPASHVNCWMRAAWSMLTQRER